MGLQALMTPIKAQWFLRECSGFHVRVREASVLWGCDVVSVDVQFGKFPRMVALSSPWPNIDLGLVDPSEESTTFFEKVGNYTTNDTKLHAGITESSSYLACKMLIWIYMLFSTSKDSLLTSINRLVLVKGAHFAFL